MTLGYSTGLIGLVHTKSCSVAVNNIVVPSKPYDNPTLASTHPHHKHIPPNTKRNRIPAPNMSFTRPNLSAIIREIEEFVKA